MSAKERLREVRAGKKNVGGVERLVRGTLGPTLIVVGIVSIAGFVRFAPGTLGLVLSVVITLAGARMTQTAITQRCYVNAIIGRDSCRMPSAETERPATTEA